MIWITPIPGNLQYSSQNWKGTPAVTHSPGPSERYGCESMSTIAHVALTAPVELVGGTRGSQVQGMMIYGDIVVS